MRRFWLFRSNLIPLEYYHEFKDLDTFEKNCHDYYMLLPLWLLQNNFFDEVTIWRLTKNPKEDIIFDVNGKKYIQKWVTNFNKTFDYPSPDISYWRGGFQEYDQVTKIKPNHFGLKLYLGAGRRQFPQYGGNYDACLMEDERDFNINYKCVPFYKTASPHIFHPIVGCGKKWDICWPSNFTQIRYKGQEFFMKLISENKELQKLSIIHCGNKPEVGKKMAKKYGLKNIEFLGLVTRPTLNIILNSSKFGLNLSNIRDGCPRVSTEVLMSGTPLILRTQTRLLNLYKKNGVVIVDETGIVKNIKKAIKEVSDYKRQVDWAIKNEISFDKICQKNINLWQKI